MRRPFTVLVLATLACTGLACASRTVVESPLVSTTSATTSTASRSAESSVAMNAAVTVRAHGCAPRDERGAGSMVEGGYVLTAAHVVAGASSISVRPANSTTDPIAAQLMAIDPVNDLALLRVPGVSLTSLAPSTARTNDRGVAVVFRNDAPVAVSFAITQPVIVNILDIYQLTKIQRPGYLVDIRIAAGDSGAVLVGPDNRALGVLYAQSRAADNRAFATNMSGLTALVKSAKTVDQAAGINTGRCP